MLVLTLASCMDETLVSTIYNGGDDSDKNMYLRVNVPRTYAMSSTGGATKETLIQGIDVLVFTPGVGSDHGKYFLKSASKVLR